MAILVWAGKFVGNGLFKPVVLECVVRRCTGSVRMDAVVYSRNEHPYFVSIPDSPLVHASLLPCSARPGRSYVTRHITRATASGKWEGALEQEEEGRREKERERDCGVEGAKA
jgi:hypothetical protein